MNRRTEARSWINMALVALATAGVIATIAVAVAGLTEQPAPQSPAPPAAKYAPALQRTAPPFSKPIPSWDWFKLPDLNMSTPNPPERPLLGEDEGGHNGRHYAIAPWEILPIILLALRLR